MKYAIYFDYASPLSAVKYEALEATNLLDAIEEADKLIEKESEEREIYLTRILEQRGKMHRVDGCKTYDYEAVLCRRSYGWHLNNAHNCESKHYARQYTDKYGTWFEYL